MTRYEAREITPDDIEAASELLAERHRRHRVAWPALNARYEDPQAVRPLIEPLLQADEASGAIVYSEGRPLAYVVANRKDDAIWGGNAWVDVAGNAANDPEALRHAYAFAAERWVAAGQTSHYVVVPATDEPFVDAWFSLSFGLQHVHALRERVDHDFEPELPTDVTVRLATEADIPALVELDPVLTAHVRRSPVFAAVPFPTPEESLADVSETLADPRYTDFVAEYRGRVVGAATACSLEMSNANSALMRPVSCGFLGWAAVLPEAQGVGAGRALSDAVFAWSRDEGYEHVATDWRSTNIEANRSWRSAGYRPSFYRLVRSIG